MEFKEYTEGEGDENFKLSRLQIGYVPDEVYNSARDTLSRGCHDIFLRVTSQEGKEGILLITRQREPMKGILWSVGGGIKRGVSIEESLRNLVRQECNLEIKGKIYYINTARFFFRTNPSGSGKGVDDLTEVFYAAGNGQIKLDELHNNPMIITREKYTDIKERLHLYVRDNITKIFMKFWWEDF
jgi:ADP-ribose pyrophosphatase YjhB (NUDIX family)